VPPTLRPLPPRPRPRVALSLRDSYVPFGWKFVAAVGVLVGVTIVLGWLPEETPSWIPVAANIIVGAAFGVSLQPVPEAPSNRNHAEFAVSSLADTTRYVGNSRNAVQDLLTAQPAQVAAGLLVVQNELDRTLTQLTSSVQEWDRIEPGVVDRVLSQLEERDRLRGRLGVERSDG